MLLAARRTCVMALALLVLAAIACTTPAQSTAASAYMSSTGYWLRWTPPDGKWQTPTINILCAKGAAYCHEARDAATAWGTSVYKPKPLETTSASVWLSRFNSHSIPYEISDFGDNGWGGTASLSSCVRGTAGLGGCRQAVIHTNLHYNISGGSTYTASGRRTMACQELGHAFGLAHASGDCMGYAPDRKLHPDWTSTVNQSKASMDVVAYMRSLSLKCTSC